MSRDPWRICFALGPVCEAGQHGACAATQDAYSGDVDRPGPLWVCSCACHEHAGELESSPRASHQFKVYGHHKGIPEELWRCWCGARKQSIVHAVKGA